MSNNVIPSTPHASTHSSARRGGTPVVTTPRIAIATTPAAPASASANNAGGDEPAAAVKHSASKEFRERYINETPYSTPLPQRTPPVSAPPRSSGGVAAATPKATPIGAGTTPRATFQQTPQRLTPAATQTPTERVMRFVERMKSEASASARVTPATTPTQAARAIDVVAAPATPIETVQAENTEPEADGCTPEKDGDVADMIQSEDAQCVEVDDAPPSPSPVEPTADCTEQDSFEQQAEQTTDEQTNVDAVPDEQEQQEESMQESEPPAIAFETPVRESVAAASIEGAGGFAQPFAFITGIDAPFPLIYKVTPVFGDGEEEDAVGALAREAIFTPLDIAKVRSEEFIFDDDGEKRERRVRGVKFAPYDDDAAQRLHASIESGNVVLRELGKNGRPRGAALPGEVHFAATPDAVASQLCFRPSPFKKNRWTPHWCIN